MKTGLTVVCLIAALLAGLGASAAVASPLLTAEEMSMVKGGCVQLYCNLLDCAAGEPHVCDMLPDYVCIISNPNTDCNLRTVWETWVRRCLNGTDEFGPCTQRPLDGCGQIVDCNCIDLKLGVGVCLPIRREGLFNRHYYPCEDL